MPSKQDSSYKPGSKPQYHRQYYTEQQPGRQAARCVETASLSRTAGRPPLPLGSAKISPVPYV